MQFMKSGCPPLRMNKPCFSHLPKSFYQPSGSRSNTSYTGMLPSNCKAMNLFFNHAMIPSGPVTVFPPVMRDPDYPSLSPFVVIPPRLPASFLRLRNTEGLTSSL